MSVDRVDRNVQRLLHMLIGIKRLKRMLDGIDEQAFLADDAFTLPEV